MNDIFDYFKKDSIYYQRALNCAASYFGKEGAEALTKEDLLNWIPDNLATIMAVEILIDKIKPSYTIMWIHSEGKTFRVLYDYYPKFKMEILATLDDPDKSKFNAVSGEMKVDLLGSAGYE